MSAFEERPLRPGWQKMGRWLPFARRPSERPFPRQTIMEAANQQSAQFQSLVRDVGQRPLS